jgi:hypothetical protein
MNEARLGSLELNPRSNFEVRIHAAVLLVVDHVRNSGRRTGLTAVLSHYPFLSGYLDAAMPFVPAELSWAETHHWWVTGVEAWERAESGRLPICRLTAALGLDPVACSQLIITGLVDEDSRFGRIFSELNGGTARRPTLETVAAISRPLAATSAADPVAVLVGLIDDGLLRAFGTDQPRSEWIVQPAPELWEAIRGDEPHGVTHKRVAELPDLDGLVTTDDFRGRCARVAAGIADLDLVVVRGTAGSDRIAFAEAVCRISGRGVLRVDGSSHEREASRFGPLATALDAVPVIELDLLPGETAQVPCYGYRGPVIAILGATGGVDGDGFGRSVSLEVPRLDADHRALRWRAALAGQECHDIEGIAAACSLQGRHIDVVSKSAQAMAKVDGVRSLGISHVRAAAGDLHRQLLDDLATRLEVTGEWDDVVVGDFTAAKLAELETRCRHRERIGGSLRAAYGRGTGIGVRALFTGASGTGKTLAATVLGSRLGLDVHRLDLAAVVNKYVGETEKNLHRVLTTAEELDVVLLIDEGDSLLGRRTEVRSANDRFANLETNYLLQRLEHYRGIVVITTNAPDHVDVAFQRRMDVVVSFLPPSPRERADIWWLHLPPGHQVSGELVTDLSHRCTMTGGQIRNAVLHAVLLAMQEERPVGNRHVEQAVASEYQKAGASSPYDPSGRRHTVSHARAFQEVVT